MLPAAGVGHEEVEEEVVLSMGVEETATEHGTLGAVEFPVVGTSSIVPIIGMAGQRESLFETPMRCPDLPQSLGRVPEGPGDPSLILVRVKSDDRTAIEFFLAGIRASKARFRRRLINDRMRLSSKVTSALFPQRSAGYTPT